MKDEKISDCLQGMRAEAFPKPRFRPSNQRNKSMTKNSGFRLHTSHFFSKETAHFIRTQLAS